MRNHLKRAYEILEGIFCRLVYSALQYAPANYYQPIYGASKENVVRACEDRWAVIAPHLDNKAGALLDIGCNVGFFTFMAAEKGKLATGIDADPFYVIACHAIARAKNIKNVQFLKGMVTKEYVDSMPSYDVVFNFSVFHHWVKAYGEDGAIAMMKVLASKSAILFFETGQPDEKGTKWADKLSFMGDRPDEWIRTFLKDCGYTSVEIIGTFATGLTSTDRYLFLAKK